MTRISRTERCAQVHELRKHNPFMYQRAIAERLGISLSYVNDLFVDPLGNAGRDRKRRYEKPCAVRGRTINPNGLTKGATGLCQECFNSKSREEGKQRVIAAIQRWNETYGQPPAAPDWNPGLAKTRKAEVSERFYSGDWPTTSGVQQLFGTFRAGIEAAGFDPLQRARSRYPGDDPAKKQAMLDSIENTDLQYTEIARKTGISVNTVQVYGKAIRGRTISRKSRNCRKRARHWWRLGRSEPRNAGRTPWA